MRKYFYCYNLTYLPVRKFLTLINPLIRNCGLFKVNYYLREILEYENKEVG